MEVTDVEQEDYNRYVNLAIAARGEVINAIIILERLIDIAIARYFCKDEGAASQLMELILCTDRMIFKNKRLVFQFIVENKYPEFKKDNPLFFKVVDDAIELRNVLAHYLLNAAPNTVAKENANKFSFIKFKNTASVIQYNKEQISTHLANIQEMSEIMVEFNKAH